MNERQKIVAAWYANGCDYNEGVTLYLKLGQNKSLKRLFPGREKRYGQKLIYELCKSVRLSWKDMPKLNEKELEQLTKDNSINEKVNSAVDTDKKNEIPKVIRRVKHEYQSLYKERSLKHKELKALVGGENNINSRIEQRKVIIDLIDPISLRLDVLVKVLELYEKEKQLPIEAELWPTDSQEHQEPQNRTTADIKKLKDTKKKLQNSISRFNNLLKYQTTNKQEDENPMPDSPRKREILEKIAAKKSEMKLVQEEIDKL